MYLGRISYGLYAYQGIAFWLIGSRSQPKLHTLLDHLHHGRLWFQLGWLIVALTFNILIATVSFELFERRILRLKEKFATVKSRPGG